MLNAIFTLDYEIHGNGAGDPYILMVEPTRRLLEQFDAYGAKLTIMVDVAEVLKFREYAEANRDDRFHYAAIRDQLLAAISRGHDVQLHLHSSYFNSKFNNGRWEQDYSEYSFANLSLYQQRHYLQISKNYIETLLRTVRPDYNCTVFRAANWSMHPSRTVVSALIQEGFQIDTSVFKYGKRSGNVRFDYTNAHSDTIPWRCSQKDVCLQDLDSCLWEVPIYAEERPITSFVSLNRIYRALVGRIHPVCVAGHDRSGDIVERTSLTQRSKCLLFAILSRHAWKADFNQCTGRQLIAALERVYSKYGILNTCIPFTLIGHSKLVTRLSQFSLASFLAHVADNPERFRFSLFRDLNIKSFDNTVNSQERPTPSLSVDKSKMFAL